MSKQIRNFLTHPLMKVLYGTLILAALYYGYTEAWNRVVNQYNKITKITVQPFSSSLYRSEMAIFSETDLEILYPLGAKLNVTKEDALAIAEQSLKAKFHTNPKAYRPFSFYYDEKAEIFMLVGSDPLKLESGQKPGHPTVLIRRADGKVLGAWLTESH